MLTPGQTLDGRWVVDRLLGRGGMAVVHVVHHAELGSRHALKILSVDRADLQDRLLVEGRIQARLQHPNVVRVHDVLRIEGRPGLVMDYVDGPALDEWLHDRGPVKPEGVAEVEAVFRGIVAGVQAAHAQGLVHRDLKPANVLLMRIGGTIVPKVTDFGIAKVLSDTGEGATAAGLTLGTPRYMAPEQIREARSVDVRADVYALGCILYEMLAGRPVVSGSDVIEIHASAMAQRRVPLETLVPGIEARFVRAVDGALVGDREQRLPDCAALLAVLDGKPLAAVVPAATWAAEGEVIAGRFRLLEVVHTEPGATVHRALEIASGTEVSVKVVPHGSAKTEELVQREATVLKELHHPRILAVREVLSSGGTTVLVRDRLPGPLLERHLAERRLHRDEVLAVAIGVLEILVYVHGLVPAVVLRDLSPARFARDADGRIHLVDLPVLRDRPVDPQLGGQTFDGTFGYMAPEQYEGDATPATDAWGFGALLVHLLARQPPAKLMKDGKLEWRQHVVVDSTTTHLLSRLLDADPGKRPTAVEALAILRVLATPEPAPQPPSPRAAEAPHTPVVGLADAPPPVEPEPFAAPPILRPPDPLPATRPRTRPWVVVAALAVALVATAATWIVIQPPAPPPTPASAPTQATPDTFAHAVNPLADKAVQRGLAQLYAARFEDAASSFLGAVGIADDDPVPRILLAWTLLCEGQTDRASAAFDAAARLHATGPAAELADALSAAINDADPLRRWLEAHPDDDVARLLAAEFLSSTEAARIWNEAQTGEGNQPLVWLRPAERAMASGFPVDAETLLVRAVSRHREPTLYLALGRARLAEGKLDEAAAAATAAAASETDLQPDQLALEAEIALLRQDETTRAALVAKATRSPVFVPFGRAHADALAREGRIRDAIALLRQVITAAEAGGAWDEAAVAWSRIVRYEAFVQHDLAPDAPDLAAFDTALVGSSRVDLQACKLEYSIVSPK